VCLFAVLGDCLSFQIRVGKCDFRGLGILITTGGAKCKYQGEAKSSCQTHLMKCYPE
jgi:hypothetical protein